MHNPAKLLNISAAANTLMLIASRKSVEPAQLQQLASYFVGSDSSAEINSFLELVHVARGDEHVQSALLVLATDYQEHSGVKGFTEEATALRFIQSYSEIVGRELLRSQPITLGFARRIRENAFDAAADQISGLRGWLMLYTVEGVGILDSGVRQLSMHPGHAALIEPGAVFSYQRAPSSNEWGHYWVAFQPGRHWRDWLNWPRVGPHLGYLAASQEQRAPLEESLAALNRNFLSDSPMKSELDHNLLEQLILRCSNLLPAQSHAGIDPRVVRAQEYVEENFNRAFTIEQVAAAANVSSSGLAHLFKEHTGTTVMSWRDEKRMTRAAQLLRNTREPIASIATAVGFADPPFFTRTFKRLLGQTPRQYRSRGR